MITKNFFGQVLNFHGDNFVLWVHVNGSRLRNQKSALNQNSVNSFYTSLQILNPPGGAVRCARGAKPRCLANHSSRLKPTYSIGYVFCSFSLIVSLKASRLGCVQVGCVIVHIERDRAGFLLYFSICLKAWKARTCLKHFSEIVWVYQAYYNCARSTPTTEALLSFIKNHIVNFC